IGTLARDEARRAPGARLQAHPHLLDVVLGRRRVPAPGEPRADAAPQVAGLVRAAALDRVEPLLPAVVVRAQDRRVVVGVERGRAAREPRAAVIRRAQLEKAERLAVVAVGAHVPPGLLYRDRAEQVLGDAVLPRGPLDDLVGRAPEVPGDAMLVDHLAVGAEVAQLGAREHAPVLVVVVVARLPPRAMDVAGGGAVRQGL